MAGVLVSTLGPFLAGRVATTSYDGMIRLYGCDFKQIASPSKGIGGNKPFGIAFSRDGATLAVGYFDAAAVDLFDGRSLEPLSGPNVDGLHTQWLTQVAWAKDGKIFFAGAAGRSAPCRIVRQVHHANVAFPDAVRAVTYADPYRDFN